GVTSGELTPRQWGVRYREILADPALDRGTGDPNDLSDYDAAVLSAESMADNYRGKHKAEFNDALLGRVPVEQHLEAYLIETNLAPKTLSERRGLVKRFAHWGEAEGLKLPDIGRREAGRYVS